MGQAVLAGWQNRTADPWLCSPHSVLEESGAYSRHPACLKLDNY